MKRTEVTYGQLDKVLRSLGFSCRATTQGPPGRIYEHKTTGAVVMLPEFSESDRVFEHHLAAARLELDNFGLADPSVFAAKLQRAGSGSGDLGDRPRSPSPSQRFGSR